MDYPYLFWTGFHLLILLLLFLDLGIFHRKLREISVRESLLLSACWIFLALLFNTVIYFVRGPDAALQFFTGFLVEKSLSIDNLFVFLMIFSYFKIPLLYQYKVLYFGIIGALVFRIALILAGIQLIQEFQWMIYLLGLFLLVTGAKFALQRQHKLLPEQNALVRLCKKIIPLSEKNGGGNFFLQERGKWKMTNLFLVLLMIESSDVVFALDSIPAIFAITTDPFIVYTSNIFAILGLRSLYFALAHTLNKLKYFKFGMSAILVFVGVKMLLSRVYPISVSVSLVVIAVILTATIVISMLSSRRKLNF